MTPSMASGRPVLTAWRRIPGPPRDRVKARLLRLYRALLAHHGPQGWWPARTPRPGLPRPRSVRPGIANEDPPASARAARRSNPRLSNNLHALLAPAASPTAARCRSARPARSDMTWRAVDRRSDALPRPP